MQRGFAAAIVLYWIVFWAEHDRLPPDTVRFELSFLFPDLVIVGLLWIASRRLLAGDPRGKMISGMAGGALLYLGLLDVMFNLWRHQYTGPISRGLVNGIVNAGCILFGLANIWFAIIGGEG